MKKIMTSCIVSMVSLTMLSGCGVQPTPNNTYTIQQVDFQKDVAIQSAQDAVLSAMDIYSYFVLFPLTLDRNQPNSNSTRFRVKEEALDTFDELRELLLQYFSEEITQELLSNGMYEDEEGYLYATGKGRLKDESIFSVSYQTTDITDTQITYEIIVTYKQVYNKKPKTLYFIRERIHERWVYTSFPFFW